MLSLSLSFARDQSSISVHQGASGQNRSIPTRRYWRPWSWAQSVKFAWLV